MNGWWDADVQTGKICSTVHNAVMLLGRLQGIDVPDDMFVSTDDFLPSLSDDEDSKPPIAREDLIRTMRSWAGYR